MYLNCFVCSLQDTIAALPCVGEDERVGPQWQWQQEVLQARGWRQRGALKPRKLQEEQVGVIEEQSLKLVFATVFSFVLSLGYFICIICVSFEPLGMFL